MKKGEQKVKKVMHEFKHGDLHSGSKSGPVVKGKKQALDIALSEARKASGKGRKIAAVIMFLAICAQRAVASPYFRPLDFSHSQPVVGALMDPTDLGNTEMASLLPIFTHSPKDGCLMPSIVCEDWSPLAVGVAVNAGKVTFDVGPIANVLPWMQAGALAVLPDSWTAARQFFQAGPTGPVTFSGGPVWEYSQRTDKGYFKVFSGVALHF